jgi:hypothetical protein
MKAISYQWVMIQILKYLKIEGIPLCLKAARWKGRRQSYEFDP